MEAMTSPLWTELNVLKLPVPARQLERDQPLGQRAHAGTGVALDGTAGNLVVPV
jgi:hypothetical protein